MSTSLLRSFVSWRLSSCSFLQKMEDIARASDQESQQAVANCFHYPPRMVTVYRKLMTEQQHADKLRFSLMLSDTLRQEWHRTPQRYLTDAIFANDSGFVLALKCPGHGTFSASSEADRIRAQTSNCAIAQTFFATEAAAANLSESSIPFMNNDRGHEVHYSEAVHC